MSKTYKFDNHELQIVFKPHTNYIARTAIVTAHCELFTPIIMKDGIEHITLSEIRLNHVFKLLNEIFPILDIQNFDIGILTIKGAIKCVIRYN
jgi:hypothetical protein